MKKKIKYDELISRLNFLLEQYKDISKNGANVMNFVKQYLYDETYDGFNRAELLDYLTIDEDGVQLVRLVLLLSYVSQPQNKEVVTALTNNIFYNNFNDIKSIDDVLELFNIPFMISILNDLSVISVDDVYEEEIEPKRKRLLH